MLQKMWGLVCFAFSFVRRLPGFEPHKSWRFPLPWFELPKSWRLRLPGFEPHKITDSKNEKKCSKKQNLVLPLTSSSSKVRNDYCCVLSARKTLNLWAVVFLRAAAVVTRNSLLFGLELVPDVARSPVQKVRGSRFSRSGTHEFFKKNWNVIKNNAF